MADDYDRSAALSFTTDGRTADSADEAPIVPTSAQKGRSRRRAVRHAGPPVGETEATKPVVLAKTTDRTAEPATERIETKETSSAAVAAPPAPLGAQAAGASAADAPWPRRPLKSSLAWVITALVIVALLAATVVLLFDQRSAQERDNRRQAFVDTARQTVMNLTTIHPETAKEDVDRIVAGASGQFLEEFQGREDPFVEVVKAADVTTEGDIIEAGIEEETKISANVLVAARTMVTSAEQPEPSARDFRMRVTVTEVEGKLTASKVEFVP
ncbi:hypothetical protein [Rhodococcus marinonascens]|uniref:hypothetical protein n=1 Tax=Rhodococcus marinonascens TaxID=38311 RepID=UPI001FEB0C95|nr:hypothetical protein [Rhodococcus marinonascens]